MGVKDAEDSAKTLRAGLAKCNNISKRMLRRMERFHTKAIAATIQARGAWGAHARRLGYREGRRRSFEGF